MIYVLEQKKKNESTILLYTPGEGRGYIVHECVIMVMVA